MSVITITQDNFEQEVLKSEKAVVVDFWASWCGPCRMQSPIIDELAESRPDIRFGKVNVDEESELAAAYGINSIPTIIIFKAGLISNQVVGLTSKNALEKML